MADLVGALETYSGDLNELAFVSVASVAAQCQEGDVGVVPFLVNVVGTACPGYFATQKQILDDAQESARELNAYPVSIPPCTWLKYYAPIVLRNVMEQPPIAIGDIVGFWRITAQEFRITGATVIPPGVVDCYYGVYDTYEWIYRGKKPVIEDAGTVAGLCGNPSFDRATDGAGLIISRPGGGSEFKKGSINVSFL